MLTLLFSKPVLTGVFAQQYEIEVLLLNVEKLMQFKQILDDMKKGYEIVVQGYGTIKNLAEGNFSLHDVFLDKLMQASPAVRNYYKVAEIIRYQIAVVREYKEGMRVFKGSKLLLPSEMKYVESLYSQIFSQSLESLDALASIITARQYRMSDDERLARIDRIHQHTKMQLIDLRKINGTASDIIYERSHATIQIDVMRSVQGIAIE
jgi:hypothetical protein